MLLKVADVSKSDDGRYVVVNGRRWRASDPSIPKNLQAELVEELMAARRLVKSDPDSARSRVHAAKVALGERGPKWWEEPTAKELTVRITATIEALSSSRAPGTVCPSEVARVVGGDRWRKYLKVVRDIASDMAEAGGVVITRRGREVPAGAKGPVRISRPHTS